MLAYVRENPYRAPSWRWMRAAGIVDQTQLPTTRRTDGPVGFKWINEAVSFRRALDQANSDMARQRLARRKAAIFWAHHTWQNDNPIKWHIEALILARASSQEIGFSCGIAAEIVEAYENLFFHVREKLHHKGYIVHCVLGPGLQRGLYERDFDVLWKLYGYFLGPHVLDSLISKFVNPTWCSTPDMVSTAIQDDAIGTLKLKAAIAAKTVPVTMNTQMAILETFTKFVEIERTTDSAGRAQGHLLEQLGMMMDSLPLNVGGLNPFDGHKPVVAGPVQAFAETNIELSFQETMQVGIGRTLANADAMTQLSFPPTAAEMDAGGSS